MDKEDLLFNTNVRAKDHAWSYDASAAACV